MSPLDDLQISVSQAGTENQIVVLRLDGVLDTLTAPQLDRAVSQLLQQRRYRLVLDLSGIDYISSAGWGIFVSHIKEVRDNSGDLKLARMLPEVHEIFELLEFDSIIRIYDSVDKATLDFPQMAQVSLPDQEPETAISTLPSGSVAAEVAISGEPSPVHKPVPSSSAGSLEEKILSIVQEDPLLRISEIKELLKSGRFGEKKASRWKIFLILRRNRLLRLRKRCLFPARLRKVLLPISDTNR